VSESITDRMPFLEHLRELRTRLVRSVLAIALCFVVGWVFREELLYLLKLPLLEALAKHPDAPQGVLLLKVMEKFFVHLKVALFGGILIAAPFVIYQIWRFVDPAFYDHERRLALPFVLTSSLLFIGGVCFCYFVMLPFAFNFLIQYSLDPASGLLLPALGVATGGDNLQIALSDHVSLTVKLILGFGFAFQTPLFITLACVLGITDASWFARKRGIAVVLLAGLSALLTPQDPWSLLLMLGPLWFLYEVGIVFGRLLGKKRATDDDDGDDDDADDDAEAPASPAG